MGKIIKNLWLVGYILFNGVMLIFVLLATFGMGEPSVIWSSGVGILGSIYIIYVVFTICLIFEILKINDLTTHLMLRKIKRHIVILLFCSLGTFIVAVFTAVFQYIPLYIYVGNVEVKRKRGEDEANR